MEVQSIKGEILRELRRVDKARGGGLMLRGALLLLCLALVGCLYSFGKAKEVFFLGLRNGGQGLLQGFADGLFLFRHWGSLPFCCPALIDQPED